MAGQKHVQHFKTNTPGNRPASDKILVGEIAINYHKGEEKLFIKNDSDEIVSFDASNQYVGRKTTDNGEIFNDYTNNKAGNNAHAEGQNTTASGVTSHTEGQYTTANGTASHAEGNSTVADGVYSHTEGYKTITSNEAEHAEGKYNKTTTGDTADKKTISSIGIGSSDDDRKNAVEVMQNGDVYVYGLGGYIGNDISTAKTLQEVVGEGGGVGKKTEEGGEIFNDYENNKAGLNAHAENSNTSAKGENSHSEGYNTTALGNESRIGGKSETKASDTYTQDTPSVDIYKEWVSSKNFSIAVGNTSDIHGTNNASFGENSIIRGQENTDSFEKDIYSGTEKQYGFKIMAEENPGEEIFSGYTGDSLLMLLVPASEEDATKYESQFGTIPEFEGMEHFWIDSFDEIKSKIPGIETANCNIGPVNVTVTGSTMELPGLQNTDGNYNYKITGILNPDGEPKQPIDFGDGLMVYAIYLGTEESVDFTQFGVTGNIGYFPTISTLQKTGTELVSGKNGMTFGYENHNMSDNALVFGEYNRPDENLVMAIGDGNKTEDGIEKRSNLFEIKKTGEIYAKNIGGFDGTKNEGVKSVQETINDINTFIEGIVEFTKDELSNAFEYNYNFFNSCIYTTTGVSQNIQILYKKEYAESVEIVETGEMLDVSGSGALFYTFAEVGEHPIKIKFKKDVTSFYYCFYECYSLTAIPESLFANNPNVTSFSYCFRGCSFLTTIPEGLFANNKSVTDFSNCFNSCKSLTSIPEGLFANNKSVTDFSNCFNYCSELTSIPEGLFANNKSVTDFSDCFYSCKSLTSIPENLFVNNKSVTKFSYCFYSCSSLTGTTPKDSDGGELWERAGKPGYPVMVVGGSCFTSCTNLSNYSEIPSDWK